ncbi:MAG: hypothetical protein IE933_03640 [Sphingomonadales bacterium]|nr:hypothetical protein [Sphingomonadales bacterium]MBD3772137.1 hypothetical protein [Paracoccaceae bacterium]
MDFDRFIHVLLREIRAITADHPLIYYAMRSDAVERALHGIHWSDDCRPDAQGASRVANEIEDFVGYHGQPLHYAIRLDGWRADCAVALSRARRKVL